MNEQAARPVLRPMTIKDLDAVVALQRDGAVVGLAEVFPQDEHPFPTDAVRERWLVEIADPHIDCFVILDASGDVAGFAATRNNEFLHFGTALPTWGSGLADVAHDAVLDHLRAAGHESAWLRVFEGNERGRAFYANHGWHPTGERSQSTHAPFPVLLTYERALSATPALEEVRRELAAREPVFHHPEHGNTREHFDQQTIEDYWEVGASGAIYTREDIWPVLEARYADPEYRDEWTTSDFRCRQIGTDTYLLTYLMELDGRVTRRSTVWRQANGTWQAVYHQGTIVGPGTGDALSTAREALLDRFRWIDGHADIWAVLEDHNSLQAVLDGLAAPWRNTGITAVVGIESRGFLLGAAVADRLGVGFHAIRKQGSLFAGRTHTTTTGLDYRGNQHTLSLRGTLGADDRVLMVDDWAERGAQALAARTLVEQAGAQWLGLTVMVDQLTDDTRDRLGTVTRIVTAPELGDPDDEHP